MLILSEFAGAAHSLNGALIVNPWNTAETANALNKALTMDDEQREDAHNKLFRYVSKYTAAHWVSLERRLSQRREGSLTMHARRARAS